MLTFDEYVVASSESSLPKSTRTTSIPNASELAKALTILQGDQYSHIRPLDYVSHLMHTEGHRCNIEEMLSTNKVITDWVQKSVLKGELEKRAGTLVFFIMTAEVIVFIIKFLLNDSLLGMPQTSQFCCCGCYHHRFELNHRDSLKADHGFNTSYQ